MSLLLSALKIESRLYAGLFRIVLLVEGSAEGAVIEDTLITFPFSPAGESTIIAAFDRLWRCDRNDSVNLGGLVHIRKTA